ncbi:MAG: hypothetical protein AB1458_16890 [Bacteroidota bacterium]
MNSKQKGFSALVILLIIVGLGIIGGTGWYVFQANRSFNTSIDTSNNSHIPEHKSPNKPKTETVPEIKWLTYKHDDAKLTFQYPENWTSKIERGDFYDNGHPFGISGTLTSPKGKELKWTYMVAGGSGGGCEPAASDIPFSAGNKCATKQIVSVEKVREVIAPQDTGFRNLFMDSLYITRTKHMDRAGKLSYQVCLDAYNTKKTATSDDETPEVGTQMGFLMPCAQWRTGFGVKFSVENEADFKSEETIMAERIMKTFDAL